MVTATLTVRPSRNRDRKEKECAMDFKRLTLADVVAWFGCMIYGRRGGTQGILESLEAIGTDPLATANTSRGSG